MQSPLSVIAAFFRANKTFFTILLGVVFVTAGYFWWQAGFTLDVSRFFAAGCDAEQLNGTFRRGQVSIVNNNDSTCDVHVTVWEVYYPASDPRFISTQVLFDQAYEGSVAPGATATLSVDIPDCVYQYDIGTGTPRSTLPYGYDLIDSGIVSPTGLYCGETGPTPTPTRTPTPSVSPTPTPIALACAVVPTQVVVGSPATVTATGGTGAYTWSAPGGTLSSTTTNPANVSYATAGSKTVTVTSGGNQNTCSVVVVAVTLPTPTPSVSASPSPTVSPLTCAPSSQTVAIGAQVQAASSGGGTQIYSWSAPGGNPSTSTNTGSLFTTSYGAAGSFIITVTGGGQSATCAVTVQGPTASQPHILLTKLARNITHGSNEADSVTASPGNDIEFSLRVLSDGVGTVVGATIRDALPAGLTYVRGSTRIDSATAADGIVSTGLALGDIAAGRAITIRFRALVSPASFFAAGTSVLTNTAYARGTNTPEVSDVAFVSVMNAPAQLSASLAKMGRNTTRGETGEHSPVRSSPGETIQFVLRARNTSSGTLTNVLLRDILPSEITLVPGSVRIGTTTASDTLVTTGASLGTLVPGQEVLVTFSGVVAAAGALPAGATTVLNTATLMGTGIGTITAQLPVVITNGGVAVPPVNTGPAETTMLALIISAVVTLLYVGYTSTDTYRRHEASILAQESRNEPSDFNS